MGGEKLKYVVITGKILKREREDKIFEILLSWHGKMSEHGFIHAFVDPGV